MVANGFGALHLGWFRSAALSTCTELENKDESASLYLSPDDTTAMLAVISYGLPFMQRIIPLLSCTTIYLRQFQLRT